MDYNSAIVVAAIFLGGTLAFGIAAYAAFYALTEGVPMGTVILILALAELPILIGAYGVFSVGLQ